MHANKREEIDSIEAGDIAACVGLKNVTTGDTLCDEDKPIVLESIDFPTPVISVAIEPKTKADQEKMGTALAKLAQEDPTFRVHTDDDTGQTLISGMGELHLEIIVDRMMREFGVQANVGRPQVAYRETIIKVAKARASTSADRRPRPVRPRKAFVHPLPNAGHEDMHEMSTDELDELAKSVAGKGGKWRFDKEHRLLFIDKMIGGSIPKEFIAPIETGIREAMENGVLAGYEMVDIAVVLIDGSYHDVDSSEMAFKIAGSMAFKEACRRASPEAARADHARGSGGSRGLHGPGDFRPEFAARPVAGPGIARGHGNHQRAGAAGGDVRLCDRYSQPHAGPRQFYDAFFALPAGAAERFGRNCRQSKRRQAEEVGI